MLVAEKKIVRMGNSQGVVIPAGMCEALGIHVGDAVELIQKPSGIEVRPRVKRDQAQVGSLAELFEGYGGGYRPTEADWGAPVGRETW